MKFKHRLLCDFYSTEVFAISSLLFPRIRLDILSNIGCVGHNHPSDPHIITLGAADQSQELANRPVYIN